MTNRRNPEAEYLDRVELPPGIGAQVWKGWWVERVLTGRETATEPVRYGQGYLPRTFELDVYPERAAGDVEATWMVALLFLVEDGEVTLPRVYCTGTEQGMDVPEALEWLRKARPLSWWKRYAIIHVTFHDELETGAGDLPSRQLLAATKAFAAAELPVARRRDRVTDHLLQDVAEVYRRAWEAGDNPTQAVASHFHKSHSTAARWVGLARKAGHLGAANGSRGGEKR